MGKAVKKKAAKTAPKSVQTPNRRISGRWLVVLVFVSAWMFVLGVLVGRGTAPVRFDVQKLEKELAALKEAVIQKERAAISDKPDQEDASENLVFYEALKEKGSASQLAAENIKPKAIETPEALTDNTSSLKAPPSAKVSKKNTTKQKKRTVPAPAPPKSATKGDYTIQVAAVKDAGAADRLIKKLRGQGFAAYRITSRVEGKGTWYRVRVGHFPDENAAAATVRKLKAKQYAILLVRK
jgi:cell division septation protein DedD